MIESAIFFFLFLLIKLCKYLFVNVLFSLFICLFYYRHLFFMWLSGCGFSWSSILFFVFIVLFALMFVSPPLLCKHFQCGWSFAECWAGTLTLPLVCVCVRMLLYQHHNLSNEGLTQAGSNWVGKPTGHYLYGSVFWILYEPMVHIC